jgi:hypothetical protein
MEQRAISRVDGTSAEAFSRRHISTSASPEAKSNCPEEKPKDWQDHLKEWKARCRAW